MTVSCVTQHSEVCDLLVFLLGGQIVYLEFYVLCLGLGS